MGARLAAIERATETVSRVATAIAAERELPRMIGTVLDQTVGTLGGRAAHVYLVDDERPVLNSAGYRNIPDDLAARILVVPFEAPLLASRAATSRSVQVIRSVDDVGKELALAREVLRRSGSKSMVSAPLISRDCLVGVLTVAFPSQRAVTPEAMSSLKTCSEIFAVGIANARATTRERQLNAVIAAERARLEAILENAPHGIIFVEHGTDHASANSRARALTMAQASNEILERLRENLYQPDGRRVTGAASPVERALRGERLISHELVMKRTSDALPVFLGAAPAYTDDELLGVVLVLEDASSHKELERLRDEWASLIAHDLKTPLHVIMSHVGLLDTLSKNGAPPEKISTAVGHTQTAVRNLTRMIGDLLDTSALEAQRLSLRPARLELLDLVRSVAERAALETEGRRIVVDAGRVPTVRADSLRVEQVLANLLANACKYSPPESEVRVEVKEHGGEVRVAVVNEGDPIPTDEIPLLFERWYRTRNAREGKQKGLGLGLYIAKGLICAHGGKLEADSTPEGVTTFAFTLPIDPW